MIDWATWQPAQRATLLFILREEKILLIHKLRGFGAGKVNGPGGKIDPGESALDAALRETFEELDIMPLGAEQRGQLHFQFHDGYSLQCTVFLACDFLGQPRATAEAIPFWVEVNQIPYAQMWADDRHWLPLLISGAHFDGYFEFAGEQLLAHQLVVRQTAPENAITKSLVEKSPPPPESTAACRLLVEGQSGAADDAGVVP